jgi:hypothetical protein
MQDVPNKPPIICLCGSTQFTAIFNYWRKKLSYERKIVLSIGITRAPTEKTDPQFANPELKAVLDELHLRKIDLADEVMVLDVDRYIGESTAKEIAYAKKQGKRITYLSEIFPSI